MTGPTTQEYQPLSQALQFHSQQPRLQLAPREQLKPSESQQEVQDQPRPAHTPPSPAAQCLEEHATSVSSSREVSPAVGIETSQTATGQKRKPALTKDTNSKKRKTDQAQDEVSDVPVQYGLGPHYSYPYPYPGVPPPPPVLNYHQPSVSHPTTSTDMGFNEFQWRLLNLCGEFYEAATELIRSTPHLVLSQAFQILDRGTGMDPISVLNDARRTCDILFTNPQALAAPPPPPTALSLAALTSLTHLNTRQSALPPTPAISSTSYYPAQSSSMVVESYSPKSKEKERASNNVQGTWKAHEVQKLKALAEKYKIRDKTAIAEEEEEEEEEEAPGAEGDGEGANGESVSKLPKKPRTADASDVDWDKVVEEFGDERSRHQVLIKATYLGLKPSSTLPGKKLKRKKSTSITALPPPLTFSSANAKSVPTGYNPSPVNDVRESPSATPSTPTVAAHSKPATTSAPLNVNKTATAPPPPMPPQLHTHPMHAPYGQTSWYPPQTPYYAYHQPMYYSPHPQSYGMQGYGMQPPLQGYYPPHYAMPSGMDPPPPEKQTQAKAKRKDSRKDDTVPAIRTTPVPPPSLPPRVPPAEASTTKPLPAPVPAVTTNAPKPSDTPASGVSPAQASPSLPSTSTSAGAGSSGVLRRGPNNSLFTYTPLPHGPGGGSTEQAKET